MTAESNPIRGSYASRLAVDSIVGVAAGFALSWFITPMDRAVMESMATHKITVRHALRKSLRQIISAPHRYMVSPQFKYVLGTYSGTYLAKDYTDTICKATHQDPEHTAFVAFWLVFAVNGGLSVFWKDPGLARIVKVSAKSTSKATPPSALRITYLWWLSRDTTHILGASVLPDYLEKKFHLTHQQWQIAQLTCPLITQLFTTPLHLLGLDYFNYYTKDGKKSVSIVDRLGRVRSEYGAAVAVRMVRMWAPWSIGLLINRELRDYLNGDVHED